MNTSGIDVSKRIQTRCVICGELKFCEVFPERLRDDLFTPYAFSARRSRKGPEHYQVVRCKTCNTIRSNNILEEEIANKLYSSSGYLYGEEAKFAAETYIEIIEQIRERLPGNPRILEIGCGSGFFLEKLQSKGFGDFIGVEPSSDCIRYSHDAIKSRIINDTFKPGKFRSASFDLAVCFHTIDHLYSPGVFVDEIKKILTPGGYFVCVCHDVSAWSAKILGENSFVFDVEHVHLFDKKTMRDFLERRGFVVERIDSLTNRYPLGYWLRLAPCGLRVAKILPQFMLKKIVALSAGNLFVIAQKPAVEL